MILLIRVFLLFMIVFPFNGQSQHFFKNDTAPAYSVHHLMSNGLMIDLTERTGAPKHYPTGHEAIDWTASMKDVEKRKARGRKTFIINMSMSAGFAGLAIFTGVRAGKKDEFEDSFLLTMTSVSFGILGTGNLIVGLGAGLPLWKAKGKQAKAP